MARMSVEEYRALAGAVKAGRSGATKSGGAGKRRGSKYGSRPTGRHASAKEHRRAAQLYLWEKAGIISNLREQVEYTLIPAQYGYAGTDLKGRPVRVCIERSCKYRADFVYEMDGQTVVEDTKGFRTKDYIIKRKLMLYVHGIQVREI